VVPVFGLHPWWVDGLLGEHDDPRERARALDEAISRLEREAASEEVSAIGETGLDGARGRLKRSGLEQEKAFRAQLVLSSRLAKPVVLHVVRAHEQALAILAERSGAPGIIHSFSGNRDQARRYQNLGWSLSFSARITFEEAHEVREALKECPADRLLLETDAPDQPPFGHADAIHSPMSLLVVAESAAKIRSESAHDLLRRSRDNAQRIFRLH
jgi:TatD DNase family protein